eukprot:3549827-Pleurochrysis_carterae.AAC.1
MQEKPRLRVVRSFEGGGAEGKSLHAMLTIALVRANGDRASRDQHRARHERHQQPSTNGLNAKRSLGI